MNREFLKSLKVNDAELPKEVIDSIMAEYGKAVKEKDEEIETLTTTKDSLDAQLKETNDKVKKLSEIDADKLNEEIKNLTEKYEKDTKELNEKLSKQEYGYKVKELTSGLKFSSESAKKSFISDLNNKGLKLEDGKILGFDDFVTSYKEQDPNAFAKEEDKNDSGVSVNTGGDHSNNNSSENNELRKAFGLKEK